MHAAPKGGVQQRLKRARVEEPAPRSLLAEELVRDTMWGVISPQLLQRYAALAGKDVAAAVAYKRPDFVFTDLQRLGGLGSSGVHPNNTWADLKSVLRPHHFRDLGEFRPPMTVPGKTIASNFRQDINDPHAFFAQMFESYPEATVGTK